MSGRAMRGRVTPKQVQRPNVHTCSACRASLNPTTERLSAEHYAVRFGDGARRVFCNDVQLFDVIEVYAGSPGTALRVTQPAHVCPCGGDAVCCRWIPGNYRVE